MTEYEMRLEAIVNVTPEGHPGLTTLVAAATLMRETSKYIREAMNQSQNRVKVLEVQRRLADNHEVIIIIIIIKNLF